MSVKIVRRVGERSKGEKRLTVKKLFQSKEVIITKGITTNTH